MAWTSVDFELSDEMDEFLVEMIAEHPTLYDKHNYTTADELVWDEISKTIGVQSEFSSVFVFVNQNSSYSNLA